MDFKSKIRSIPDFPKEGIIFRDITTLLKEPAAYRELIDWFKTSLGGQKVDVVIGPEARGFVIGSALAYALGAGLVLARKPGKLPYKTVSYSYELEYGEDSLEVHVDSIRPGMKVAVVDDLLATGGTALAVCKLAELCGGEVVACRFAIELSELSGRERMAGYNVESAVIF